MLLKRGWSEEEGEKGILSFHQPDSPEVLVSPNLSIPVFNDLDIFSYVYTSAQIHGPCNGLVCIPLEKIILLCNPALRQFKQLPRLNIPCAEGYTFFAVDFGFGFDPNTGAYKIVQFSTVAETDYDKNNIDYYFTMELYDSASNSWKHIDTELPMVCSQRCFQILFNGVLHWSAGTDTGPFDPQFILCFDISTEATQFFDFPAGCVPKYESPVCLMVLNDSLALVGYKKWEWEHQPESFEIDIWVMKEYGVKESWTKQFVIGPYTLVRPLLFLKNEWMLIESDDGQFAICALHENQFKRLPVEGFRYTLSAVVYEESLINLNDIISDDRENP